MGCIAAALIGAATFLAGCGDSLPEPASPEEKAACASLEDIERARQLLDEDKLRASLRAAVRHADQSGNGQLQLLLHHVNDNSEWLESHAKVDDDSMTVLMSTSAYLTLARVECRERGLLLGPA